VWSIRASSSCFTFCLFGLFCLKITTLPPLSPVAKYSPLLSNCTADSMSAAECTGSSVCCIANEHAVSVPNCMMSQDCRACYSKVAAQRPVIANQCSCLHAQQYFDCTLALRKAVSGCTCDEGLNCASYTESYTSMHLATSWWQPHSLPRKPASKLPYNTQALLVCRAMVVLDVLNISCTLITAAAACPSCANQPLNRLYC
jgi:hypothetical protein